MSKLQNGKFQGRYAFYFAHCRLVCLKFVLMFVVLQFKVYSHFTVRSFRAVNCIFLILPSVLKKSLCKPSHNAYRRELHGDKYLSPFRPSPHLSSPSPLLFSTLSPSCNTHSHPQLSPQMIVAMPVPETIITYQLKLKKKMGK